MPKSNDTKKRYLKSVGQRNAFIHQLSDRISFSFSFFQSGKGSGQSFEDWEKDNYLSDLNNKLKVFSDKNKQELLQSRILELYDGYPKGSRFTQPLALPNQNVKWARFRLTGARRLIGFFVPPVLGKDEARDDDYKNVFYIVFLDKNHEFAPYHKK